MRIQVWSSYFWPDVGGTEFFLENLLPALRNRGHEIQVISYDVNPSTPYPDDYHGIRTSRFPMSQVLESRNLAEMRNLQKRIQQTTESFSPDLHFLHSGHALPFFLENVNRIAETPVVVTMHSEVPFLTEPNSLLGRTLSRAKKIVAVSDYVRNEVLTKHRNLENKTIRIHNSCEPENGSPREFDPNCPHIVGIGRMIPEKGFHVLLDAFSRLSKSLPNARLTLVGGGPELSSLQSRCEQLNLDGRVGFTAEVDSHHIPSLIDAATIVCMPSLWQEPFGYVALQAQQQGRPVVASRVGGLPEIITDGTTGRLIPAGDVERLAAALLELLTDTQKLAEMAKCAQSESLRKFPFDEFVDQYENALSSVIQEP